MLNRLREEEDYRPDIILLRYVHSPFITSAHVTEAIDSMILYGTDTVLAVLEDLTYHWRVGRGGLSPVGYQKRVVRQDKDIIYKEVGGLYACQAKNVTEHSELVRGRIGHIEVAPYDALRIDSPYQYWTARQRIEGATPWSVD
jgi:CMP-N-acetylneuraminic acid synthetase